MKKYLSLLTLIAPATLWAGATVAPTGWELYLKMGSSSTADLVSNGGRFDGQLSTAATTANTPLVNLWCVDAQLAFNWNTSYRTNSLGFAEINGESTSRPTTTPQQSGPNNAAWASGQRDVRYEDVKKYDPSDIAGDNFRFQLKDTSGTVISTNDGALFRYRMAAYLLDQYQVKGSSADLGGKVLLTGNQIGQGKYDPRNNTRNQAIIEAVWVAMDTEFDSNNRTTPATGSDTDFWFKTAAQYVKTNWSNTSLWSKWAVVSAWVNTCSPGSSPCYVVNSGDKVQTFLTEVQTPEPGFYGLLGAGFTTLAWVVRRRKKNHELSV